MLDSTPTLKNLSFGNYTDKILQLANETFATMYQKIHKQYWHDGSFLQKMSQNYTTTDWQNATFETYIPTADIIGHGLSYYRIAIKLIPEVNNKTFHEEAEKLRFQNHSPPGNLDSELQIVISPRLNQWGFIRAFNHTPQKTKGYQTRIYITNRREKASPTRQGGKQIVTPPEVLWVKITRAICEFLNKRITAFLKAMKLQPYQLNYKDNNTLYYTCIQSNIFSRYCHSLRMSILSMSHCLDWLLHKIWLIQEDIGLQTMAKHAIQPLLGLKPDDLSRVFSLIREELEVALVSRVNRLGKVEMQILAGG